MVLQCRAKTGALQADMAPCVLSVMMGSQVEVKSPGGGSEGSNMAVDVRIRHNVLCKYRVYSHTLHNSATEWQCKAYFGVPGSLYLTNKCMV